MPAQPLSTSRHDNTFPMLKEHLTNVIDELVNVSNRCKINSFDATGPRRYDNNTDILFQCNP
jgi:hypothetical protein